MKIMLLNDNANLSHAGCQAVSDAIARRLGAMGHVVESRYFMGEVYRFRKENAAEGIEAVLEDVDLCEQISAVDLVLCNGEGSIHHGAGTELLAVLGAAQTLGKVTILFNAVFQETPGWERVLCGLEDFTVRDPMSLAYVQSLDIHARLVPDISLEAEFTLDKGVSLAGKDVLTDWHPLRTDAEKIVRAHVADPDGPPKFYLPFHSADTAMVWRSLPSMLSDCRVLVTGRHHGAYMAGLCGCPMILLGSNTHKIEGIKHMFPKIPLCNDYSELPAAIEYALSNRDIFTAFAHTLEGMLPLSHFDRLGSGDAGSDAVREVDRLARDLQEKRSKVFSDAAMLLEQRSKEFVGC